jgi:hypothetical protein
MIKTIFTYWLAFTFGGWLLFLISMALHRDFPEQGSVWPR